jgi:hypothetical protein
MRVSVFGKGDTDRARRAFVRAVFALIEGGIFALRQIALHLGTQWHTFTPAELVLLEEKAYDINDRGEVTQSSKYLKFVNNIKFVFAAHARVYGITFRLNTQDPGWDALVKAVRVRNRITQPKKVGELKISSAELKYGKDAADFYIKSRVELSTLLLQRQKRIKNLLKFEHTQRPFKVRE